MASDPRFKGAKGDDGIDGTNGVGLVGPVGPAGKAAEVDYSKLVNDPALLAVLTAKMPPTIVHLLDGHGQVYEQLTFPFGQPIKLPATIVTRFARDGKSVLDQEAYPLGTSINMRFGSEIIPSGGVR